MVLSAAMLTIVGVVPGLSGVFSRLRHMSPGWVIVAGVLELASCAAFVAIFRRFFDRVPRAWARRLAWTEMGSGALLPGGGVGALAVGGWLLHRAGMPTPRILERSSGLFLLTSALNATAVIVAAALLALGIASGPHGFWLTWLPALGGVAIIAAVFAGAHRFAPATRGSDGGLAREPSAWGRRCHGRAAPSVVAAARRDRLPRLRHRGALGDARSGRLKQ